MPNSIANKTLKSVAWNAIDRIASYGISFVVSIILARLLTPEDYGLIGIINIFIAIFNTILDGGFSTALIRKQDATEQDYNTVFYTNLLVSIFLSGALFFCSDWISNFFKRPELCELLKVMSIILIINAVSIIHQVQLTKKLDFRTQTIISVASNVISGALGIGLAFKGLGVWALVVQQIISRLLNTFLLFIFNRWHPKFQFSRDSFIELFAFGWKILVSRLLTSVWGNIYQAVIGKVYSTRTLGLYTRAAQYGQLFSSGVSDVVLKVSLPIMSSVQEDRMYLLQVTRRIIKQTMFVTCLCMFAMIASAPTLIYVMIGEQWIACVPFLQILCITLMVNPIVYIYENLLTAIGRSDRILLLQIVKLMFSIIPLLLGIWIDIWWMLIGSAVTSWMVILCYGYYIKKEFKYRSFDLFIDLAPSVIVSLGMAVPVYASNFLPLTQYILFPLQVVIGFAVVFLICKVFKIEEYIYVKTLLRNNVLHRK